MSDTKEKPVQEISRRGVLQAAAVLVAAPVLMGGFSGVGMAAERSSMISRASGRKNSLDLPLLTKKRTLGNGKFSMEVSALGFGVMGANYNRGTSPDRKKVIEVIRRAAEHGVTLFDTAQVYGPLTMRNSPERPWPHTGTRSPSRPSSVTASSMESIRPAS